MYSKYKAIFVSLSISLTSLVLQNSAVASSKDGANGSGGGYVYCDQFSNMVGRIASQSLTIGQSKFSEENAIIEVKKLWEVKQSLSCLPVHKLDRQARSNPEDKKTQLLVDNYDGFIAWQNISLSGQMRLAAHELCVLAGYEKDGEYFISDSLINVLKKNSKEFNIINITARDVIQNPRDGSVTLIYPYVMLKDGFHSFDTNGDANASSFGVCRFFNLGDSNTTWSYLSSPSSSSNMVVDVEGHIVGPVNRYGTNYLNSVTCIPRTLTE